MEWIVLDKYFLVSIYLFHDILYRVTQQYVLVLRVLVRYVLVPHVLLVNQSFIPLCPYFSRIHRSFSLVTVCISLSHKLI
jgi:hypothetical protein